jgi:hypothetical protein
MALIEKAIADELVDLRLQESTGTGYIPISDAIAALQRHLECEQQWRALLHDMTDTT